MKRLMVTLTVVAVALGIALRGSEEQPKAAFSTKDDDRKVKELMRHKLASAQKVNDGRRPLHARGFSAFG